MKISEMQQKAYQCSKDHGFHDDEKNENVGLKLCLIHSELSEALEDFRDAKSLKELVVPKYKEVGFGTKNIKPEGFVSEIADVIIRCGDLAGMLGFDLEKAVEEKMAFNLSRPFKHGRNC
jgi:NTP pyrophosphatase (non-canonical NTP hydrolase)